MKQVAKRVMEFFLFILILSFISFIFMKAAPGDPVRFLLNVDEVQITGQEIEELREELGFNDPILVQYGKWVVRFFMLDLGTSFIAGQPVLEELLSRFPDTLILTAASLFFMILISVPIGALSALYKDKWVDHSTRLFALLGASIPSFWLGLLFIQIFSVELGLLPSMGKGSLNHLILPSLTLGLAMSAVYVRLLRASLLESFGQDFVRSARARGLEPWRIFFFYSFRHALAPVITIFGVSLGSLLAGTVIIEVLFAYPGIGKLVVDAIVRRDYPVIQGYILFMGIFVVLINIFEAKEAQ